MLFEPKKIQKPNLGIRDLFLSSGHPVRHLECPDYEIVSQLLHCAPGDRAPGGGVAGIFRREQEVISRFPDTKYPIFCSGCGAPAGRAVRRLLKHEELPETFSKPKQIKSIICGYMWVEAEKVNSYDTLKMERIKQGKGSFLIAHWATAGLIPFRAARRIHE